MLRLHITANTFDARGDSTSVLKVFTEYLRVERGTQAAQAALDRLTQQLDDHTTALAKAVRITTPPPPV